MVCVSTGWAGSEEKVGIVEADYEGRAQFKITAAGAIWFYDRAGGGFSRIIDREGRDWIAFHRTPLKESPAGAAAGFRGLPNLVFGRDNPESGVGHPGFDLCESAVVAPNMIRTTSKSGAWAWTWHFTATHTRMSIERVDAGRPWWFLYEGPPGGRFMPREQYWGTNLGGPRRETPGRNGPTKNITGQWRWAYFGDDTVQRVLFVAQCGADELEDQFYYMGSTAAGIDAPDGMVVFGFGRAGARPLMTGAGERFVVGFIEQSVPDAAAHARVAHRIEAEVAP